MAFNLEIVDAERSSLLRRSTVASLADVPSVGDFLRVFPESDPQQHDRMTVKQREVIYNREGKIEIVLVHCNVAD